VPVAPTLEVRNTGLFNMLVSFCRRYKILTRPTEANNDSGHCHGFFGLIVSTFITMEMVIKRFLFR
jgi:hypothetical protein